MCYVICKGEGYSKKCILTSKPTFVKRLESYARAREVFGDDQDAMLESLDFLDVLFYERDQEY